MNILKRKSDDRILGHFVLSYLLVFILPFTLLSYFWFKETKNNLITTNQVATQNKLKQSVNLFNNHLTQLQHISEQISLDSNLSEFSLQDSYSNYLAQGDLNRYKLSNPLLSKLFIYYKNQPHSLYSDAGMYNTEDALVKYQIFPQKATHLLD